MAFSGALTLTDLNDFITPSQACIKPVEQTNASKEREPGAASTDIVIDASGAYYEVSSGEVNVGSTTKTTESTKRLAQAQINLNDCLACSGCITSAESVLITLQSHTEVLDFLEGNRTSDKPKIPVVSISPQSLASLAASLSSSSTSPITPLQVLRRLEPFVASLGFAHVFDTTFARELALVEHVREFVERQAGGEAQLPMLASACPGWICYAEKTHSEMLGFIARTKSPQQVMGTLVKEWMGKKWGRTPDEIYHVTVMPCYDKKLEASRQDFYNDIYSTRDVDCVITTGELEVMMLEKGWDLSVGVPEVERQGGELPEMVQHAGTSSGSYLHSIMGYLQTASKVPLRVDVKTIRNGDYEEYSLTEEGGEGRVVFKGAKCYGFRNLQNVVRKVGKERGVRRGVVGRAARKAEVEKKYDYVEVMACPGGCVNGGGQLKGAGKEWSRAVEAVYWLGGATAGNASVVAGRVLDEMCGGDEERRRRMLRTEYRKVESEVVGLAVKW